MATRVEILGDAYQLIAEGPCFIEAGEDKAVRLHFASEAPSDDTEAYHIVTETRSVTYSGTLNTYARADKGYGGKVVVT